MSDGSAHGGPSVALAALALRRTMSGTYDSAPAQTAAPIDDVLTTPVVSPDPSVYFDSTSLYGSIPGKSVLSRSLSLSSISSGSSTSTARRARRGANLRITSIPLGEIDEEPRETTPNYDREFDLAGAIDRDDRADADLTLTNSANDLYLSQSGQRAKAPPPSVFELIAPEAFEMGDPACPHSFFAMPQRVKHSIYSYLFPLETRKINLSSKFSVKMFADGYFASPWDIIDEVRGLFHASAWLRGDCMVYFWTEYHFHVTIQAFSGPKFSPLSHVWLSDYLHIIQRLTIEVDFTKFGGSALKSAPQFGYKMAKEEGLLKDLVRGLSNRYEDLKIAELNIMCRRYEGVRPNSARNYAGTKYCPDNRLYICDVMADLRGLVRRARVSGFPLNYTKQLLFAFFADGEMEGEDGDWHAPLDVPWPILPPTPETSTRSSPPLLSPSNTSDSLGLSLRGSRSFTEDVYEELSRHDMRSSVYTFESSSQNDPTDGSADDGAIPDSVHRSPSVTQLNPIIDGQDEDHRIDGAEYYSKISQDTMRAVPPSQLEVPEFYDREEALNFATAMHRSATLHKLTRAASSTTDINKINEMNEQDPAFVRATEGLRASGGSQLPSLRNSDIVEPRLSLESADRSSTIPTRPKLFSSVSSGFRSLRRRPTT